MASDLPETGRGANQLGVRIGPSEKDEIAEEDGWVQLNTGGMSVAPTVDKLPTHRIPRRLREKHPDRFPDATGSNQNHCWSMGEGEFIRSAVTERLMLRPDPENVHGHGFVEPHTAMKTEEYEGAITATQSHWQKWGE
jgi:hypothetical protein